MAVKVHEKREPTQRHSKVICDTLGDCLWDTIPEGHIHRMNPVSYLTALCLNTWTTEFNPKAS